jgi:putative transposase
MFPIMPRQARNRRRSLAPCVDSLEGRKLLSRWMHWLLTTHVGRYLRHSHSRGHVWQGQFKAFPIEADEHMRTVLRYVERNPLRAELVWRAEDWRWSSLGAWLSGAGPLWRGEPALRDSGWLARVNEPLSAEDLKRVRRSTERGTPYGGESWTRETAERLGLESCLRPRGRPKKM